MIFPEGATRRTTPDAVEDRIYDAVIVGTGISGAIMANELSRAGKTVLMLEAGPGEDLTLDGYLGYLNRFYAAASKDNQAPYPPSANAPMPRSTEARKITPGVPSTTGYLVQTGPFSSDTTYTRVVGGTTMHWEAKVPRLLPEDFEMHRRFDQGIDWPLGYKDLEGYYKKAEFELGVSADGAAQSMPDLGVAYDENEFPMRGIPLSYLDKQVAAGITGTTVELYGKEYSLGVRAFPQARNGVPNPNYTAPDGSKGYLPVGAVSTSQVEMGGRCQGNNNCVPLCPVQAKYHAGKTLAKALHHKDASGRPLVDILPQAVASKVRIGDDGRVIGIDYKRYHDPMIPGSVPGTARGRVYILSANAIENARLMLASGLQMQNGLVGRNLMDHAYLLNWALMPQVCGTGRGTNCTGGIVDLRGGEFRRQQAAFSVDIHNDGWGWAVGSPMYDINLLVEDQNKFGRELRGDLVSRLTRQLQLAFMIEVMPSQSNRVSVDPAYTDQLGNMRPVISYNIPEYTMRGVAYARRFAKLLFQRLGAEDHTSYDPSDYGYVTYEGEGYVVRGGNHLAGTHIMGAGKNSSVVNVDQKSWDHDNLYLIGGGSIPTIGTANITVTIAALCFRTSEAILRQLAPARV